MHSLEKAAMSICTKIILQMNSKLGSPLWLISGVDKILKSKTMMIGISTSFRQKAASKFTVVGVVSSLDPCYSIFYSRGDHLQYGDQLI